MAINFIGGVRMSAAAFAVSALVTACGGGGGGSDAEATQAGVSSTNSGGTSTTTGTTTGTAGTTTSTAGTPTTDTSTTDTTTTVAPPDTSTASTGGTTTTTDPTAPTTGTAGSTTGGDSLGSGLATTVTTTSGTTIAPVTTVTTSTASTSKRSGAGLNLGPIDIYSTGVPTVDLMKRAGAWLTQCQSWTSATCTAFPTGQSPWDTTEEAKLDLDTQGWVKSLPANNDATVKYRMVTTALSTGGIPDGLYVVKYDGQGTLTYSGSAAKVAASSTAGRDVIQVTNSKGGLFLTITATTPSNYLRNIRVYPPGGACANDYSTYAADATTCGGTKGSFVAFESFPATKPWYPLFFADLKGFRTLRYMDWMKTNSSMNADWANRSLPTDRTWAGANGVPLETIVDLSNDSGTDPWVNIPTYASDDYVHQFARLAHQRLASNLKLNMEYSNEAWNYAFPATNWMLAQAKAAWPTQVAAGANVYTLELNWYAQRLAQVCTIAKQEFGADASRVTCIANTQAALSSNTNQTLACTYAAAALGKACGKFFDVVAIAPYFGYYVSNLNYRSTITSWYTDADGGLTKLFEEINGADPTGATMTAPLASLTKWPVGARGMSNSWMVSTKAVADKYGLAMWAYEGGQHLVPPGGDTDAAFLNLITTANRDPRMQASYQQDLADWKAAGGQTFTYYNHVGVPSKYGMWGAKVSLDDQNAPKWKAIVQARDGTSCWWSGC